ncbi:MAG: DUF1549 and DUF1553 domain-containing protein, partial [Planctomycetes bacterium]|nr:DUF1549 and DUF1553 domain-containing protein [Planctomycetota bacterium]
TLECCQCHDHKYDPFTMKDYYRLFAFFNSTEAEAERSNPEVPSSITFRGPSMPLSNPPRDQRRAEYEQKRASAAARLAERRGRLAEDLPGWADQLVHRAGDAPQTSVLEVVDFQSNGTTDSFEVLDDGSVLLVGADPPETDVYTVRVRVPATDAVVAFRLDALTHDSLPGKGPGRGDTKRTNFVLNEFSVTRSNSERRGDPQQQVPEPSPGPLAFASARADFSQQKWDVGGAVDGDPETGWAIAPKFGEPHWAMFVLKEPLDFRSGDELTFRLEHHFGGARSIGRLRLSAVTGDLAADTLPAAVVKIARQPVGDWSKADRDRLLDFRAGQDPQVIALDREIAQIDDELKRLEPDTTLVMVELEQPRATSVFQRGDYRQAGDPVQPGVPAILHEMPDGPASRLALARWLVDPANPLVARVTVNRWWAELFGTGIVPTVEDFGIKGDPPSHPDLLDWLSVEFMESGWSMKHILRTIVLSSTYRQSSCVSPELLENDDTNRWLARGPRFRMDAEMIRDNALAIAGLISLKPFGPPIRPYQPEGIWSKVGGTNYDYVVSPGQDRYRRGVYVILKRGAPYPSFVNFDGSARLTCTVKRSRTNTPLQALTLLNDPVYAEAARSLAGRIVRDQPAAGLDDRLVYAFRLCTARRPEAFELQTLRRLYEQQMLAGRENKVAAQQVVGDTSVIEGMPAAENAAWIAVATTLLNLHETITKE